MSRRDNGMGTVYQRSDGRWTGQVQIGTQPNGKPWRKTVYGKTRAEAMKNLRDTIENRKSMTPALVAKTSFEEYSRRWLELYKKPELKPSAYDRLECTLINNVFPHIGMIQMTNLASNDIQNLINNLTVKGGKQDNGYSYSTIKKVYDAINECIRHACIKGELSRNPILGVKLPSKKANEQLETGEIKFMTSDQIDTYCKEALRKHGNGQPVYRLGAGLVFILATGLRSAEAVALKWTDNDDEYVSVSRSIVTVKSRGDENSSYIKKEQNSNKSKSGKRKVPLNTRAKQCIDELKVINGNHEYLFATKSGKVIGGRNLYRTNADICKAVGIKGIDVHALRHTFASMLFAMNVPVKTVSELLGHSDVGITQKTYIHLIPEQKKAAVAAIDF
jgi:integrase